MVLLCIVSCSWWFHHDGGKNMKPWLGDSAPKSSRNGHIGWTLVPHEKWSIHHLSMGSKGHLMIKVGVWVKVCVSLRQISLMMVAGVYRCNIHYSLAMLPDPRVVWMSPPHIASWKIMGHGKDQNFQWGLPENLLIARQTLAFPNCPTRWRRQRLRRWHRTGAGFSWLPQKTPMMANLNISEPSIMYMEVSWNGCTPSHHPFYCRIFHDI